MTQVVLQAVATSLGGHEPILHGAVTATYWAGSGPYISVVGDEVRFPAPITVAIMDGAPAAVLDMVPTEGLCCVRWDVLDKVHGGRYRVFTSIPDTTSVDFGDLPIVDPTSFAPVDVTPTLIQTIDSRVGEAVPDAVADYLQENPPASAPDATTTAKGILQLAGDLGGNAAAPTVPGLAGKADTGHTHVAADVTDLATVAATGAYSDLSGTPTLGTAAAANTGDFATAAQGSKADTAVQPGSLAAVATTGAYDDLSGKPTLGTAASAATGDFAAASHTHVSADVTDASSAATPSVMVLRDAAGRAKFADPSVDADAATKGWVESQTGLLVPKSLVDAKGDLIVGTADNTVSRLPVGSNGQVLTADSAEATGLKWATPAGGGGGLPDKARMPFMSPNTATPASGQTVRAALLGQTINVGLNDMTDGRLVCVPFVSSVALTIDALIWGFHSNGAGSFSMRSGLYADSAGGFLYPGALIEDFGTFSPATIVTQTITPRTLAANTIYWFCAVAQGTVSTAPNLKGTDLLTAGMSFMPYSTNDSRLNQQDQWFRHEGVTGALPATYPTTSGYSNTIRAPLVLLRMD